MQLGDGLQIWFLFSIFLEIKPPSAARNTRLQTWYYDSDFLEQVSWIPTGSMSWISRDGNVPQDAQDFWFRRVGFLNSYWLHCLDFKGWKCAQDFWISWPTFQISIWIGHECPKVFSSCATSSWMCIEILYSFPIKTGLEYEGVSQCMRQYTLTPQTIDLVINLTRFNN